MQSDAPTIAAYLKSLPAGRRETMERLDRLVREVLPEARASMRYGMPTYDTGAHLVACNAQKRHFSFYADPEIVARHRDRLADWDTGKSCIRFSRLDASLEAVLRAILAEYR